MDRFSWFEKAFANRSSTNYANEKTVLKQHRNSNIGMTFVR
ncbi:hypothetical protein N181_30690 [Sinorhizobium fredii USDA 205]|uniref:Uncharacterized protein n=2 Tax=Sinorhizobium TaxID=28105 RepID=I3XGV9_SINF2|nr:hypothetical protein USDA257_p04000 [Sinorhizobium fredii USDA 257]ASY67258.1 hypothetical protein SJ05684_a39440 [Sinorhizobium sojae CCBAU 05684]AWI61957.1 hypothetical protein AB395_00004432 [Sinorhizobium fredii CCBAU 45436]AWM29885.1 hypothetical protein AOX55_00004449 [Sinorhizobium fredii CCBAU 25509]KSV91832.1 hypothetical protein N181_30690 [Sinorhizobium fredii USDA 205]